MIDTLAVPSKSRPDVTHTLFFYDGKLAGCSCEHRQFQTWVPCQHMKDYMEQEQAERYRIEAEKRAAYVIEFGIYA